MGLLGLLIVLAIGLSSCGDDGSPPAPVATQDLVRCDVATSPCQRGIYDSVAAVLGAEGFSMPNIRTISVEQHAEEVRNGLDLNDLTGEDPQSRGLRLMGFLPPATNSLTEAQADYFITQVAAYYSRGSRSITVVDRDYEPGSAQVILAHEFVHAIQDSQFNLNTVSRGAVTEDGAIGARSVIEGDAMYSSFAWYFDVTNTTQSEIDWETELEERTARLRTRVADSEVALIDTASSFPYSFGFAFMTDLSLAGGLSARAEAFQSPPATTAEVLAGFAAPGLLLDIPGPTYPAPLDGSTLEDENRYGAWYVYGFLVRQGMDDDEAWATAQRWLGDELAIYQNDDEVVAVWRVRFADVVDADALSEQVNQNDAEFARSSLVFGDDAFVFAAESTESLIAWADQPLDEMTASIVPKSARARGGPVSVGTCLLPHDPALFDPHRLLRSR
jgi:hypothetical protein